MAGEWQFQQRVKLAAIAAECHALKPLNAARNGVVATVLRYGQYRPAIHGVFLPASSCILVPSSLSAPLKIEIAEQVHGTDCRELLLHRSSVRKSKLWISARAANRCNNHPGQRIGHLLETNGAVFVERCRGYPCRNAD